MLIHPYIQPKLHLKFENIFSDAPHSILNIFINEEDPYFCIDISWNSKMYSEVHLQTGFSQICVRPPPHHPFLISSKSTLKIFSLSFLTSKFFVKPSFVSTSSNQCSLSLSTLYIQSLKAFNMNYTFDKFLNPNFFHC